MIFKRHEKEYIKPKFIEINNLAVDLYEKHREDWYEVKKVLVNSGYNKEDVDEVVEDLIRQQNKGAKRHANILIAVGLLLFSVGMLSITVAPELLILFGKKTAKITYFGAGIFIYGIYKREHIY